MASRLQMPANRDISISIGTAPYPSWNRLASTAEPGPRRWAPLYGEMRGHQGVSVHVSNCPRPLTLALTLTVALTLALTPSPNPSPNPSPDPRVTDAALGSLLRMVASLAGPAPTKSYK